MNDLWGKKKKDEFFVKRTLALIETSNYTKHLNKNKNYNKILEMPFVFNLQTVWTVHRRCRSSMSRLDVAGCRREVVEKEGGLCDHDSRPVEHGCGGE
jgi:hypothetical protein